MNHEIYIPMDYISLTTNVFVCQYCVENFPFAEFFENAYFRDLQKNAYNFFLERDFALIFPDSDSLINSA